ncbi:hypothetical protein BC941DRAFT_418109 [Chlamydoabsidia padenii]|nr:hypothetical protein BC941DRAFT_418109 [Chlamydoabsidia padenii]
MSSTLTFIVLSNGQDYQFELTKELCIWDVFCESLLNTLLQQGATTTSTTPLYYLDRNNISHTITGDSDFAKVIMEANNMGTNVIRLYQDRNYGGTATSKGEWVFAPEEETTAQNGIDPSSSTSIDGTPFSTAFEQLGQLIHKHRALIESNPHLRILIGRFASSLATTPDADMLSRLDQYLDTYNNNNDDGNTDGNGHGKDKDCRRGRCGRHQQYKNELNDRREFIATIPEELSEFLLSTAFSRRLRHRHHGSDTADQHPWMDHHHHHRHGPHPGFLPNFFGGGKHKHHHHHHEHHHPPFYPAFGPSASRNVDPTSPDLTTPYNSHQFGSGGPPFPYFGFGGRPGGCPMMYSRPDKCWKKAWKEQRRQQHYHHHGGMTSTESSSSDNSDGSSTTSNSDNDEKKTDRKEAESRHRQHRKLWKSFEKEHRRRYGHHGGPYGHHGHHQHHRFHGPPTTSFADHRHGFHGPPMFPSAVRPFPHPGHIEESFGQMHLGDHKKQ